MGTVRAWPGCVLPSRALLAMVWRGHGQQGAVDPTLSATPSSMSAAIAYHQPHHQPLIDFLERIITADTKPLTAAVPIYSALLTANGKYLADFFVVPAVINGTAILLFETDQRLVTSLQRQLAQYILRQPITLQPLPDWRVRVMPAAMTNDAADGAGKIRGLLFSDPRLAVRHGGDGYYRHYEPIVAQGDEDSGAADDNSDNKNSNADRAYHQWRIEHLLPEGLDDFVAAASWVVEYGLPAIGGVSLTKGCFVGQEVTARMVYRLAAENKLKRRLERRLLAAGVLDNLGPHQLMHDGRDELLSAVKVDDGVLALLLARQGA